jgi:hypothetical protein
MQERDVKGRTEGSEVEGHIRGAAPAPEVRGREAEIRGRDAEIRGREDAEGEGPEVEGHFKGAPPAPEIRG